jgi:hypothetical protein
MDNDYEEVDNEELDDDTTVASSSTASSGPKRRGRKPKIPPLELKIREFDLNSIPPHKPSDTSGVKIVVIGKAGCFAAGTKVLMYDGSVKNIEDIEVGEQVMGSDGKSSRTVQKLHRGEQPMFNIIPDDGCDPYTVNLMHDLVLKNKYTKTTCIVSVENYLKWSLQEQQNWHLMRSDGVVFPDRDIPEDPYDLGLKAASEDTSVDFIADEYKINSFDVRLEVLRGFVKNACVMSNGEYHITVSAAKMKVAQDVVYIARSLGLFCSSSNGWKGDEAIILLRLKGTCLNDDMPYTPTHGHCTTTSFKVDLEGQGNYYGFELDGNRLFLLATFDVVKNTGKSTLIRAILASKAHLAPVIQVFNGTEDNNKMYSEMCPPAMVHDTLDLNALISFKNRQTLAKQHIPENPWAVQVIDDCTDDPKILRHALIQAYYKNGRHWSMIHILSLQYSLDIMPNIRSNIDYTFLLRESGKKNIKKLYENYCPDCVETYEDFSALMGALTEDFGALVICNRTTSNKIEDCIFYCKIDPKAISPNFKFGHQTAWDFSNERYDPSYVPSIIDTTSGKK